MAGADLIKPVGALSESNYGEGGWAGWLSRLISGQKPGGISVGGLVGGQRSSVETLSGPGLSLGNGNQVGNCSGGLKERSSTQSCIHVSFPHKSHVCCIFFKHQPLLSPGGTSKCKRGIQLSIKV